MGKGLVREQLHTFIDDVVELIHEEFRPLAIVGLGGMPGNGLLRRLLRPVIVREVNKVQVALQNQFNTILDAAEEVTQEGRENVDFERYHARMIKSELVYQNYVGDRQEEFEEDIRRRLNEAAEDIAPLVAAESDEFWEALVETYDRAEAHELFEYHFSYYDRLMKEYSDGLRITTDTLIPINYTVEAERLYPQAERMVMERLKEGYDEEYERQGASETEGSLEENDELRREIEEINEGRTGQDGRLEEEIQD